MLRKIHLFGHTVLHKKNYLRVTPKPLAQRRAVERVGMWIIEGHADAPSKVVSGRNGGQQKRS